MIVTASTPPPPSSGFQHFTLVPPLLLESQACNLLIWRSRWGSRIKLSVPGAAQLAVFTQKVNSVPRRSVIWQTISSHAPLAGNYWDCSLAPAPCQQAFEGLKWSLFAQTCKNPAESLASLTRAPVLLNMHVLLKDLSSCSPTGTPQLLCFSHVLFLGRQVDHWWKLLISNGFPHRVWLSSDWNFKRINLHQQLKV